MNRKGLPPSMLDVLACVLTVYTIAVVLAVTGQADPNAPEELLLPPIDLSRMDAQDSKAVGATRSRLLLVTIEPSGDHARCVVEKEEVSFEELPDLVRKRLPEELCLRVDAKVTWNWVSKVIDAGRELGIQRISFAFKPKEGGDLQ